MTCVSSWADAKETAPASRTLCDGHGWGATLISFRVAQHRRKLMFLPSTSLAMLRGIGDGASLNRSARLGEPKAITPSRRAWGCHGGCRWPRIVLSYEQMPQDW